MAIREKAERGDGSFEGFGTPQQAKASIAADPPIGGRPKSISTVRTSNKRGQANEARDVPKWTGKKDLEFRQGERPKIRATKVKLALPSSESTESQHE